ncbi:DUF4199 domain-containing protein [Chitinophaga silvisoli]|uniref:DUF4199 domain-containing protein n=1 Tax=Chitinophaga silvisoli TaxID=2291814 RepID=A0A3E1NWV9_9BACT|nr:DUF4199 domain-containing protein [Chitinophaga silvisoli]RFM32416.1 DUF4199 domain-containing protein [Chitinophaga silvisoli]
MKPFVKFGLITGLAVGIWNLSCFSIASWLNSSFSIGIPSARLRAYSGLFGVVVLLVGIYAGMKSIKRQNDGTLTYKQAVTTGIGISVITALIAGTFAFIYCTVINPGYTDYMVQDAQKALLAAHKSPDEINQQLAQARRQFSTTSQVMQALIGQSVVGSVCSLIIGIFTKTKK